MILTPLSTQIKMVKLEIQALKVTTHIGVYAWEQRIAQSLLLDLSISLPSQACSDDLSTTIDYQRLCQQITDYLKSQRFHLIEALANQVAILIKEEYQATEVKVSVSKAQAIRNAGNIKVSVCL